jgi:hypothetical protein
MIRAAAKGRRLQAHRGLQAAVTVLRLRMDLEMAAQVA